jgi:hypothetical protein
MTMQALREPQYQSEQSRYRPPAKASQEAGKEDSILA